MPVTLPTAPSKRLQILNRLQTILQNLGYPVARNRTMPTDEKRTGYPVANLHDGTASTDHPSAMPGKAWIQRWTMDPEIQITVDTTDPIERITVLDATATQIVRAIHTDAIADPRVVPGCLTGLLAQTHSTAVRADVEPIYPADKDSFAGVQIRLSLTYDL